MTGSPDRRPNTANRDEGLLERYLPPDINRHLAIEDRAWRGRTVLLLWGLGYPLDMACSLALIDDPEQAAFYRTTIDGLGDSRLIELLDQTAGTRGDGSGLEWVEFGLIRTESDARERSKDA